jgi:hypothetical protein
VVLASKGEELIPDWQVRVLLEKESTATALRLDSLSRGDIFFGHLLSALHVLPLLPSLNLHYHRLKLIKKKGFK